MTDVTHPPGWWLASDGNWYPPHLHPGEPVASAPTAGPPSHPPTPALPQFAAFSPGPPFAPGPQAGLPPYLPPAYGYPAGPPQAPYPQMPPGYGYPAVPPRTNGLAVTSLVLAIVSLAGIGSIAGIILGFVSRAQIRRAHGTQKGAGLGLAGIIVGFVTLTLVLAAVAIPTFLGVRASSARVIHLAPTPITVGTARAGGSAPPIDWQPTSNSVTSAAPVAGGVDVTIDTPRHADFLATPVDQPFPSIQESASVAIVDGPATNGVGLGCMSEDQADQLGFFVQSSGYWQIMEWSGRVDAMVDSGPSAAIHPSGTNTVTIACQDDLGRPGTTEVSLAVNGTPVATDIVRVAAPDWWPTLQLCSCMGADTGRYLDVAYYSSPDSAGTST